MPRIQIKRGLKANLPTSSMLAGEQFFTTDRNTLHIAIDATTLVKSFQDDEANANKLYLDKVLLIKGAVGSSSKTQAGENTVTLSSADPFSGVMATLDTTKSNILNIGDTIVIKGFCKGFLSDVVITNAIIE